MTKRAVSYNERAWAVDLISEINRWPAARSRAVRSAGGEWGVAAEGDGNTLFPDVLKRSRQHGYERMRLSTQRA
jgi:hypothetical protein